MPTSSHVGDEFTENRPPPPGTENPLPQILLGTSHKVEVFLFTFTAGDPFEDTVTGTTPPDQIGFS